MEMLSFSRYMQYQYEIYTQIELFVFQAMRVSPNIAVCGKADPSIHVLKLD